MPRVVGPIRRKNPVELRDLIVLRANTDRAIKATVPGPFTMSKQAQDDYYKDEEVLALAYADAVNAEIKDLFSAGADVVQIDEPVDAAASGQGAAGRAQGAQPRARTGCAVRSRFTCASLCRRGARQAVGLFVPAELEGSKAQQISIEAAQPEARPQGVAGIAVENHHSGVIDLSDMNVETPQIVAEPIRRRWPTCRQIGWWWRRIAV